MLSATTGLCVLYYLAFTIIIVNSNYFVSDILNLCVKTTVLLILNKLSISHVMLNCWYSSSSGINYLQKCMTLVKPRVVLHHEFAVKSERFL